MACKFFFILLFVEIWSCAGKQEHNSDIPVHDHLKLALMWPNSYCWTKDVQCRASVPEYFVVRSLWAEGGRKNPHAIANCPSNLTLTDSMIARHKMDLLKYWPDLTTFSLQYTKKLWKDQWITYGSCCANQMSPQAYIRRALRRREDINLYEILKNSGIVANGSSYPADKIISAIKKSIRVTPDIVCEADTEGTVFLSEIRPCVDNEGKKFIDCDGTKRKCDKDPIFPNSLF